MNLTFRAQLKTIAAAGGGIPEVTKAIQRAITRSDQALAQVAASPGVLAAAVLGALDAGKDPSNDPGVQMAVTATAISNEGIAQSVSSIVTADVVAVLAKNHAKLIASWVPDFDKAVIALQDAAEIIPNIALGDSELILQKGPHAAAAWASARVAQDRIDKCLKAFTALGELSRLVTRDRRWDPVLVMAKVPASIWVEYEFDQLAVKGAPRLTPWQATNLGLSLALPKDFDAYQARIATVVRGVKASA